MIKKVKGGWVAASSTGERLSKKPKSEKAAKRQLRAVHRSQARQGKKKSCR